MRKNLRVFDYKIERRKKEEHEDWKGGIPSREAQCTPYAAGQGAEKGEREERMELDKN